MLYIHFIYKKVESILVALLSCKDVKDHYKKLSKALGLHFRKHHPGLTSRENKAGKG